MGFGKEEEGKTFHKLQILGMRICAIEFVD